MFEAMTGNNDANKSAKQRAYDPDRPDARRLATIAKRLAVLVREKDATRPVTVGSAFPELSRHTGFIEPLDLVGYNYKEHLYEADHRQFPRQPMVGSENWHRYSDWRAAADNDYISGQFLWTGIDYLGETHGWPSHGSSAGLLTLAGFEKHAAYLRRSWWSNEPVAYLATRPHDPNAVKEEHLWSHAAVSRRWEAGEQAVEVLCFSNGEPRLSCNGEEIVLTRDDEHGYWSAVTMPRPAPLLLETRRGGEVVARDELRARGEAVRIDALVWQAPADAARRCAEIGLSVEGVVQLECMLRDATGEVACNELVVTAEVQGGVLIGLENGDLSDNSSYAGPRRTLEGRLVVFVRPAGPTSVRLSAPGLPAVQIACGEPERSLSRSHSSG
jgi:hypothetical protein